MTSQHPKVWMYLQKHQALLHVPINKTSSPKTTEFFAILFKPFKVIFKNLKKKKQEIQLTFGKTNPDH